MKLKTLGVFAGAALALSTSLALGSGQLDLIDPINKTLTFVFIPK